MRVKNKDFVLQKLEEVDYNKKKLFNKKCYDEFLDATGSKCNYTSYELEINRHIRIIKQTIDEDEIISDDLVKLRAGKQKLQDKNRVVNKVSREQDRLFNALEELYTQFINLLKENKFKLPDKKPLKYKPLDKILIVQLSDLHIGENVDLENNMYNYEIAGKRLKLFFNQIKEFSTIYKIKKIILLGTGDFTNNDTVRVLDKLLNNSDNRTKVQFITSYLLSQFICDLAETYEVDIAFTVGNESRVMDTVNVPNEEPLLSHNYDYAIFNILKILFQDNERITFYNTPLDEAVIKIYDHNFLICHGHNLKADNEKAVDSLIRSYSKRHINLDYILLGHIHETLIKNFIIRSGSLAGANKYSESKSFSSIASQNIIIVDELSITPIPINLQNTKMITKGYNFPKNLEEYNNMFDKKGNKPTTILKIVV